MTNAARLRPCLGGEGRRREGGTPEAREDLALVTHWPMGARQPGHEMDLANGSLSNPDPSKLLVVLARFRWGNPPNGSSSNSQTCRPPTLPIKDVLLTRLSRLRAVRAHPESATFPDASRPEWREASRNGPASRALAPNGERNAEEGGYCVPPRPDGEGREGQEPPPGAVPSPPDGEGRRRVDEHRATCPRHEWRGTSRKTRPSSAGCSKVRTVHYLSSTATGLIVTTKYSLTCAIYLSLL